jgi:hypothetical protein
MPECIFASILTGLPEGCASPARNENNSKKTASPFFTISCVKNKDKKLGVPPAADRIYFTGGPVIFFSFFAFTQRTENPLFRKFKVL